MLGLAVLVITIGLVYLYQTMGVTPKEVWQELQYALVKVDKKPNAPPAPAATRDARWQQDIDYLAENLPYLHFNPFTRSSRQAFEQAAATLKMQVPKLQDHQIVAGMMQLTASLGDGHTSAGWAVLPMPRYPIRVRWFQNALYVSATDAAAQAALGSQLVAIGATPIALSYDQMSVYLPHENEWAKKNNSEGLLIRAPLLHAAGILPDAQSGVFTFAKANGEVFTLTLMASDTVNWLPASTPPAFYREAADQNFWLRHFEDKRLLWVKINSCTDAEGFAKLAANALALIDDKKIDTLVIDWRGNGGGNSTVFWPLHKGIRDRGFGTGGTRLFGVIDRVTFSSAVMNAIELQANTPVKLIGEPTGQKPNGFGEVREFLLPNSKMRINYATRFWKLLESDPEALMPDIRIEPNYADFSDGRDPIFEAIVAGKL